jgi:hypothetical protein
LLIAKYALELSMFIKFMTCNLKDRKQLGDRETEAAAVPFILLESLKS